MKEIFDDLKSKIWQDDRVLAFRQLAGAEGFHLSERERFGAQAISLKGFKLFKGKKGKRLTGVLYKKDKNTALKTRIYDYIYYGDSKTRKSTVIEFFLPQWTFSEFLIRPKSRLNKMTAFFDKKQILFEEVPHFHKIYQIYAPIKDNLKYELNEEFLDLLADQSKIWVEAKGNFLLFYFKNKVLPIEQLMGQYEFILDLLDCLLHGHSSEEYV